VNSRSLHGWETTAAHVAVFIIAIRYRFSPDIPLGFLLAAALLPVTAHHLLRHRGAFTITVMVIVSAVSGVLLTFGQAPHGNIAASLATVQTVRVLGIALVLAALLWARSVLGVRRVILTFGLGSLASLAVSGINPDNVWKFSLSVPVTLILLSLPGMDKHRGRQLVAALLLVTISALNDSRSAAGLLLVAAALTVVGKGGRHVPEPGAWRSWGALTRVALIGVGAYLATQAAILEGVLGEAARSRTEAQISQSGSALIGGRPEMGAAFALITDRPWGYGAGTLADYATTMVGKAGMKALGYDPNNGYVENYMFGYGFEVHSLLGDLWILFGFAGAVLAVLIVAFALNGLGASLARGAATAAVTFLVLRLVWDFAFSPFPSAMAFLPLTLAVALPPLSRGETVLQPDPPRSPV